MSAFGKRPGVGTGPGNRPAFGVARPMQGGGRGAETPPPGGSQFPPIDSVEIPTSRFGRDRTVVEAKRVNRYQCLTENTSISFSILT